MMPARKIPAVERTFLLLNREMLKRHFAALWLKGREHIRTADRSRPILLYANHSCWWDGLIDFHLSRYVLGIDPYLMMDERQLSRYRFFRWIGAFSVNRESPREALRSIEYAAEVMGRAGTGLWIYPQGVMRPNDVRPLAFEGGIVRIIERFARVQIVQIVHRYEFLQEQRPEAFVEMGEVVHASRVGNRRQFVRDLEERLTRQLDGLRASVTGGCTGDFELLLRGRRSINRSYDTVVGNEGR